MSYYILDGHTPVKVDHGTWGRWMADDPTDVHLAQTAVGDVIVSTMFLALDLGGTGLVFETMIFGGPYDMYAWRFATWDEAMASHEHVVRMLGLGRAPSEH